MDASPSEDDLSYRLQLIRCHLPPQAIYTLLSQFSNIQSIFNASQSQLEHILQKPAQVERILQSNKEEIERDLSWLNKPRHGILFYDDTNYPQQLLQISNAPYALFYIGDTDYLQQNQLAMVGSRTPTAVGKQNALNFAEHLSQSGLTITSGLAHGIDTACHQGALKGIAGTVAVVANGLHTIYPKANTQLAEKISQSGCIISEAPVGTEPLKRLFPRRNRIISGLSIGTLVTEAALNSGSLITTRHAIEQGREVFAIPGSIHNPLAKGCHQLIKSGAKLVESAADILEELLPLVNLKINTDIDSVVKSSPISHTSDTKSDTSFENNASGLDSSYLLLLKQIEFEPVSIDELVERSGMNAAEIASMLLILELQGFVISQNGLYSRTTEASVN